MPQSNLDLDYCPLDPEITKPEEEREVSKKTMFLILLVIVLLIISLVLGIIILYRV